MLHNSLEQITPSIEKAARGFGVTGLTLFRRIHLPLIQTSLLSAVIIIFCRGRSRIAARLDAEAL